MSKIVLPLLVILFGISLLPGGRLTAQAAPESTATLKPEKIWFVEYVRSKPGQSEAYRQYLAEHYVQLMEAAVEEGILADFKILSSSPSHPDDWNIMILTAVNQFADLDQMEQRFADLRRERFPDTPGSRQAVNERFTLREIHGRKMARELRLE